MRQMGNIDATCTAIGLPNINANLFQLGFGDLNGNAYWSSTESTLSAQPTFDARYYSFVFGVQSATFKGATLAVRCVRAITF